MAKCLHCLWKFKPKYFLQKYCGLSNECKEAERIRKLGKTPITKVSNHRKEQLDLYDILGPKYLKKNPICQKCKNAPSDQVHHKKGREGWLLTMVKWFMAVCDECHKYIEMHPLEAIQNGWSISRTEKDV